MKKYYLLAILVLGQYLLFANNALAQSVPQQRLDVMMAQGQYVKVAKVIHRIPSNQRSFEQWLLLAKSYHFRQLYGEASKTLAQLPVNEHSRFDVVLLKVDMAIAQQQWQVAANELQQSTEFSMEPEYVLRFGQVYFALGNEDKSEAAFNYYGMIRPDGNETTATGR